MEEVWKIHPIYHNYKISNLGNLQSWNYISKKWNPKKATAMFKGTGKKQRYLKFTVGLGKRHQTKTLKLHNVVAELFIGPRPFGLLVLHKDDDWMNCAASNLEYGTQSQNIADAIRNKRLKIKRSTAGRFDGSEKI